MTQRGLCATRRDVVAGLARGTALVGLPHLLAACKWFEEKSQSEDKTTKGAPDIPQAPSLSEWLTHAIYGESHAAEETIVRDLLPKVSGGASAWRGVEASIRSGQSPSDWPEEHWKIIGSALLLYLATSEFFRVYCGVPASTSFLRQPCAGLRPLSEYDPSAP